MKHIAQALRNHPQVTDYRIKLHRKESYELFFVKERLETVRCTDTCDTEVTVYTAHDGFLGHAAFFVYPSTTAQQLAEKIDGAVAKALLIDNKPFDLPGEETGEYTVESDFAGKDPAELAAQLSNAVLAAERTDRGSCNALEVFVNRHVETVVNSRGLRKTQTRWDAMLEAIPTYNGETQSVELYAARSLSALDTEALTRDMTRQMAEVKARYEAVKPEAIADCPVILRSQELSELFTELSWDMNYSTIYGQSNLFSMGDAIQKAPTGDRIGLTMAGQAPGNVASACFDDDGLTLGAMRVLEGGRVVGRFGANRYGQYLGETPTGDLRCVVVDPGTAGEADFAAGPYLEVVSMSGLQVDFFSDYLGGEIRLAWYHDGETRIPVTGISFSGSLAQALDSIRLSGTVTSCNRYTGPDRAIISGMHIF